MPSRVVEVESNSAERPHTPANLNPRPAKLLTKIMLVQFRNDETISRHPELQSFLEEGWSIRSAVPRIVESEGTKLLVVMAKPESGPRLTRIK
jgi:hypothetical protein